MLQAPEAYLSLSGRHFAVLTHAAAPSGQNVKEAITWELHVGFLISLFEMRGRQYLKCAFSLRCAEHNDRADGSSV
jgi:hypothetical protein